MSKNRAISGQEIILGLGAIIGSILMAQGDWSVFDFGIALAMIGFGIYLQKKHEITPKTKLETFLFSLTFALLTTVAIIGLFTTLAFFTPAFAGVDSKTYKTVTYQEPIKIDKVEVENSLKEKASGKVPTESEIQAESNLRTQKIQFEREMGIQKTQATWQFLIFFTSFVAWAFFIYFRWILKVEKKEKKREVELKKIVSPETEQPI